MVVAAAMDARDAQVNDRGDVAGGRMLWRDGVTTEVATVRGFLWRDGEMHDLGGFGAGDTRPAAINEGGEVVGTSVDANGVARAVIWRPAGTGLSAGWAARPPPAG